MNCEELMDVLDNGRLEGLDARRRRQVDAHVAVCAGCARAWNLQAGLAALPDMAMPAGFAARCRAEVAAGVQPAAGRRVARHVWLLGSAASVAAVAALLVFLLRSATSTAPDAGVRIVETPMPPPPVVEAVSLEPAAGMVPAAVMEAAPEPQFTVRLVPYAPPTEQQLAAEATGSMRELLQPQVRANNADPSREQAMQSLHAALIDELRKVPGLTLVGSDPAEPGPSRKHFRLTIGVVTLLGSDGRAAPIDSRYIPVSLRAEELQPGGKRISRVPASSQLDLQAACSGAAAATDTPCYDPRGAAARMVRVLLQQVFPPHPSVTRPLQAKFRDTSLDVAQRLEALEELYKLQAQSGDAGLLRDPEVVRAAIAMAATADPALRASIWRSLRGTGNSDLIQPLIASLLQDPEDVRLAALETLTADFLGDPRVRSAVEAVAGGDARPLIRAVAERGLTGEEGWRRYVTASLQNRNSPPAQRMEALVYYLYPPGPTAKTSTDNPDYFQIMQDLLDDAALRAVAEALPEAGRLRGGNERILMSNIGYRFNQNADITSMLLRVLESDPQARKRAVAGEVLARTHGNEPRVRDVLTKALNSDPDQSVRDWIRQIMAERRPQSQP